MRRRRGLHGFRLVAAIICLLAVLTFVAVQTPPARRFATDQIIALLAREQIEFNTDQLGYNLLGASFNLRNVRIRSTTWPDAPVFATIGRLRVNMSLLQLLRGRYVVQSGSIEDVDIHYVVDEQGRDNLPRPPKDPNEPEKPLDYLVQKLSVSRANVRYENRAQHIDAQLPVSSIQVTGNDLTDRHLIHLQAAGGNVQVQDRRTAIDRLEGDVETGDDDVAIQKLHVETTGARADLTGSIKQFDAPVADLAVTSSVDAMKVAPIAKIDEPVSGRIDIDATAKGPIATPAINAHVTGSSLQFRDLRDAQIDATAAYDLATKRADLSSLQLRGPWGGVSATGNVALDGSGQSRVRATVKGLDAGTITRALRSPYITATRIDANLQAEFPGLEYTKAAGQADATLTPTAARASKSTIPIGGRIVARGTGNRVEAHVQRLTTPGADVAGTVAVAQDQRLQGSVKARSGDLAALITTLEAFLGRPAGSLAPTPISGAANVDAQLAGTINAPTATTTINAPALKVGSADGIALTAQASYAPAAVDIARADVTWKQATAHVDGRVGLQGKRPLNLNASADELQVAEILEALNTTGVPASGTISARGMVGGTLDRPMATVVAQGSNLVAYEEQIGTFNADVRLDGRDLVLSNFVVDKPQPEGAGKLTASGAYNLDRKAYKVDLKSDNLRLVNLTLPSGQHVRGAVQIAGSGAGTVSSPAGTIDVNATDLTLDDKQFGNVTAKAVAANNQATITTSADRFNLDANALVGLTRPFPATVKVRAENLDLAALPVGPRSAAEGSGASTVAVREGGKPEPPSDPDAPRMAVGLGGTLRASIDASGNLTDLENAKATVALDALDGTWYGRPFKVTSPSPVQYADKRLTVDKLQVSAEGSTLTVGGQLPMTDQAGEGDITVDLRGSLTTVGQFLPPDTNIAFDGEVMLTGSLKGTLKRIDPDLQLAVNNGLVLSPLLEPGFSDIELKAKVAEGQALIDQLTAKWGDATIEASGRVPLEAVPPLPVEIPRMGGAATFKAALKGLHPASIPGASPEMSGTISVDAEVSAKRPDLASLDGRITFQDLDVSMSGLGLAQKAPSTIRIASGKATVEQMELSGSAGDIKAAGSVGLVADKAIDVTVDGTLNVAAVSVVTNKVRTEGDSTLKLHAQGTIAEPEVTGSVDIANTSFASDNPNIAGESLNAHIDLDGKRIVLTKLESDLNGGTLTGSGSLTLGDGSVSEIDLRLTTKDVAYDAPLDLRSISSSNIRVTRRGEDIVIGGQVTIDEAGLTGDINFDQGLLAAMTQRRSLDLTVMRNPFLERVRFDIDVDTATPILVDNNLAKAEIETDLRLVGTPYEPGVLGEIRLLEGSEVRLNERRYQAEPSVITFVDERRIFPSFDLHLDTTVSNYDITITVTGTPGDTETTLTSEPSLPEPDIMSMLVTGRTLDQMRGEEYEVAKEQVLSYLAGRVGSQLGRGLQNATGLSEVRIEPTLIASEADPTARLTVGQELTNDLKLVYSTNLTDSNDQIWVAEYDVTRRFQTRAVRQEDNSYRLDFRHDVRLGGEKDPRKQPRVQPKVEDVSVTATDGADEMQLREKFHIEAGDSYDFFKIRNGVQHVEQWLMDQGYLQAKVRIERHVEGDKARLVLHVTRGPKVEIHFTGATPPSKVQEEVKTQWHRGVFDKQRGDAGVSRIREWLLGEKFMQGKVEVHVEGTDGSRAVTFNTETGPKSAKIVMAFEGASGISPDVLDAIVEQQKLERKLFTDATVVTELLQRYYREQGYLVTEIDPPRYDYAGSVARVVFTVREGPRFTVRHVTTSGNKIYKPDELIPQLPVVEGELFLPAAAENALEKIRTLYWAGGYNDVRSDYSLVIDRGAGQVDVAFTVMEGRQSVINDIRIAGNHRVSDHLINEQVQLTPGKPLDLSALARSRRNLYDTGAFSVIDIRRRESGRGLASGEQEPSPDKRPMDITVQIREVQPWQIRYGASYDTERGVGGIFDISNRNSLGGARELGLRSRYDRQLHEGRIYLNQPALKYLPKTTASVYFREELNPPTEISDPFDTNRKGLSIQSEQRLRNAYLLTYGYRLERAHTLTPLNGIIIEDAHTVAPLTATLTRETRDEVLDASRGKFLSQAFSYSPSWLGADAAYIKYFGQYFHYIPLEPVRRKPFTNELLRPRLVYAGAVRIGLSRGIGDVVPMSERFFAGGSQTMRGFGQNAVGAIGPNRVPIGGEAMLVINNEIHVPLISIFDGVAFSDIGNVFPSVRNFSLTDLRESAGIGLRVRTPWVLLRGDWGFILDRRPGEPKSRIYFSIGQAF
jgi:outer membrane protein assembly complex protein YaeT